MFLKFSTKKPLRCGTLLSTVLILFLFLLGSYSRHKQNELTKNKQNGRPNILLIVADDLGYSDLGCYGGEIKTPRLDKLATEGVRMTCFYTMGRCCPSRASILSGQYPHRVGLGHMIANLNQPGYMGRISDDALTIGQVLQSSGYRTFMSGKWHLGTNDPTKKGFEEYFGTLVSAQTYWDPNRFLRKPDGHAVRTYKEGEFYGTNAITDYALDFLKEGRETPDKPWFLYLAYNSPHFPLQAPKAAIKKYAETYKPGWDKIREQRLQKMKNLGIVPNETVLTPRSEYWDWGQSEPGVNPAWKDIPEDRHQDLARRMAIFAAMVDVMDQNIGRVIDNLEQNGELNNTLIIFISDNGACAEWNPDGFDISSSPNNILHKGDEIETMGGPGTFHSAGSGWANASNTPWRLYKHFDYEGGISSPFIARWPAGINRSGVIDNRQGHIIDLMPTILAAAGISYPSEFEGHKTIPLAGKNILPLLKGNPVENRILYFEHEGNRAMQDGKWKLTALHGKGWELYDLQKDRTELNDLAGKYPDIVSRLDGLWKVWAKENYVTPLPTNYQMPYLPRQ